MYYSKDQKQNRMRFLNRKKNSGPALGILLLTVSFFSSCKNIDLFEKNTPIPGYKWQAAFNIRGSFHISDTVSAYNIYIVLRHTDAYAYNNIWLNVGLQAPGDSLKQQKINLSLGNDAQGWEGVGMNDIWELRKLISGGPRRFKQTGEYHFNITHIMRDDPLPGVMSVGLRLEKLP